MVSLDLQGNKCCDDICLVNGSLLILRCLQMPSQCCSGVKGATQQGEELVGRLSISNQLIKLKGKGEKGEKGWGLTGFIGSLVF